MECQYVDNGKKRLYSVYHEPNGFKNNEIGVVLCPPLGQEYIRCHKLYVNLAEKLSVVGLHVIRFDYYGTGDSNGANDSIDIKSCLDDVKIIVQTLRDLCDVNEVIIGGVRFGATVSLLYTFENKIDKLILWNPVIDGRAYLKEIKNDYKKWLQGSFAKEKNGFKNKGDLENFGFKFPNKFVKEIKDVRIDKSMLSAEVFTLLIDNENLLDIDKNNPTHIFKVAENKEFWMKREDERDKSLVPLYELNTIQEWVNNIY